MYSAVGKGKCAINIHFKDYFFWPQFLQQLPVILYCDLLVTLTWFHDTFFIHKCNAQHILFFPLKLIRFETFWSICQYMVPNVIKGKNSFQTQQETKPAHVINSQPHLFGSLIIWKFWRYLISAVCVLFFLTLCHIKISYNTQSSSYNPVN